MAEENKTVTVDYIVYENAPTDGSAKTVTAADGTVYSAPKSSFSLNWALSKGNSVVLDSYVYSVAVAGISSSDAKTLTGTGNSVISNMTASIFKTNNTATANNGSLTVKAITFRNNNTGAGGAFYIGGKDVFYTVKVSEVTFEDNASSDLGSLAYLINGVLEINGSNFSRNSAKNSGGVISTSSATYQKLISITDSQFADNKTTETGARGAVLYIAGGTMLINSSIFTGNSSLLSLGGVICTSAAENNIKNSVFASNSATDGGAIYAATAITVENSYFYQNKAGAGGALFIGSTAQISGATFNGNSASVNGGALYVASGASIILNGATFITADDTIFNKGAITLQGKIVLGAAITNDGNAAEITVDAGAELRFTGAVSVATLTFSNAESNSIIFVDDVTFSSQSLAGVNLSVDIANVNNAFAVTGVTEMGTLSVGGNTVGADGIKFQNGVKYFNTTLNTGGFVVRQYRQDADGKNSFAAALDAAKAGNFSEIGFADSLFTDQVANITDFNGGVLDGTYNIAVSAGDDKKVVFTGGDNNSRFMQVNSGNTLSLTNIDVKGYYNPAADGGAIYTNGQTEINRTVFSGNSAVRGGVFYLAGGTTVIRNSVFAQNKVDSVETSHGGAAYIAGGTLHISDTQFTGNTVWGAANSDGGALYIKGGKVLLENVSFTDNRSMKGNGGALIIQSGVSVTIKNSEFNNNITQVHGGAIYSIGAQINIENTTFDGNISVGNQGGALRVFNTTVNITNGKFLQSSDKISNRGGGTVNFFGKGNIINADIWHDDAASSVETFNATDAVFTFNNSEEIKIAQFNFSGNNTLNFNAKVVNFAEQDLTGVNITINTDSFDFASEAITVATGVSNYDSSKVSFTQNADFFETALSTDGTLTYKLKDATLDSTSFTGSATGNKALNIVDKTISIGEIFFAADQVMDNVSTLISGGRIGKGVVGGVYSKNRAENKITSASLTVTGGKIDGDVFGGGYLYGTNSKDGDSYIMNVDTVNMTLAGGTVSGKIQCGISAHKYGVANVETVNLTVSGGDFNTVFGGGWAQTAGQSSVGTVNITVSGGTISELYAGGNNGKQYVGENAAKSLTGSANITVTGGKITDLYLSGKYEPSRVTGSVTLTLNGNAEITNIYGYRVDESTNTNSKPGSTEVVVLQDAAVGKLQNVDILTIAENATLTGSFDNISEIKFDIDEISGANWDALIAADFDSLSGTKFTLGDKIYLWSELIGDGSIGSVVNVENSELKKLVITLA